MVKTAKEDNIRALERKVITRARCGDKLALRELVDQHKDRLFAFIWRMTRNHHDAEEVCQDAFLKAFASLDSFRVEFRFSTWLFTIGYRMCLNRMRRKKAINGDIDFASMPLQSHESPSDSIESAEAAQLRSDVWSAVDQLSPPQRASVLLFYRQSMSCQEISRILELPVATVKSHLHRARLRLRNMLESTSEKDLQQFRNLSGMAG